LLKYSLKKGKVIKTPIKRKLCHIGNGLAVFLPKSWVQLIEEKQGRKIDAVAIEVDNALIITPLLEVPK
jgi:antitoxin component of MazEF toxin-antitoxin module